MRTVKIKHPFHYKSTEAKLITPISTKIKIKGISRHDMYDRLLNLEVHNVKFTLTDIHLEYDNRHLHNAISFREHLGYVGSWDYKKNKIYIDNDLIRANEVILVAVHETVEKYVNQHYRKFRFRENIEAHEIATVVEHEFAMRLGVNWRSYQERVGYVHSKEI